MTVRLALPGDLPTLQSIETAAGVLFREIGMTDIADHAPPPLHILRAYQRAGRAWTAVDPVGEPVGFVLAKLVDGAAHVEQISVHPTHQRQGHGRALMDAVDQFARDQQLPALTLSTFRDVAWNAPYYARLGFRELGEDELTPGLLAIRAEESALGLKPAERVFMRRETDAATS
ncbi:GNAT family N-acetyltransferase [Kribbella sp. NPDC051770]|uniref:GNAT family N-acetyltransferase n=1 Tax=Kribbella sp. NPDC051770 TaxID=3155413 RepID=UPI0034448080